MSWLNKCFLAPLLVLTTITAGCATKPSTIDQIVRDNLMDSESAMRGLPPGSVRRFVSENVANTLRDLIGTRDLPILQIANAMILRNSDSTWLTIHWIQYGTRVSTVWLEEPTSQVRYAIEYTSKDFAYNPDPNKEGIVFAIARKWDMSKAPDILSKSNLMVFVETEDENISPPYAIVIFKDTNPTGDPEDTRSALDLGVNGQ